MTKKQLKEKIEQNYWELKEVMTEIWRAHYKTKFSAFDELYNRCHRIMMDEFPIVYARDTKAQLEEKLIKVYEIYGIISRWLIEANDEYSLHMNRVAAK